MQASDGWIMANHDMDFNTDRVVEASATIRNASKFIVNFEMSGFSSGVNFDAYAFLFRQSPLEKVKPLKRRSFAILCEAVTNQHNRTLEFGKRSKRINGNDFLVRFERHQAMTETSQFPVHTFDFFDDEVSITYVQLTIDVSSKMQTGEKMIH